MYFQKQHDNDRNKIANLWGGSWQKLSPQQRQIVVEALTNLTKITTVSEQLEEKVYKMPLPEVIDVSEKSKATSLFDRRMLTTNSALTWQLVLANLSGILTNKNPQDLIHLIFLEIDYVQLNKNAITDVIAIVKLPCDTNIFVGIEGKINAIKDLMKEYIQQEQKSQAKLNYLIDEFSILLNELKSLEVVGIGAFTLAATWQLILLQEKAKFDSSEWINIKSRAIEYSNYVKSINPRLFRLSVGRIDKACKCTKSKYIDEKITEYECRYFDGKDIHVFRELSNKVGYECNKHRLQMFYSVVEQVNQTVAQPVRSAIKKWQELAV